MQEAWAEAQRCYFRAHTTIGVIDSGMMSDHRDLKGNYIPGYNVADNNEDTSDRTGHGTMVAGVAGAVINNSLGIAGIADYVALMPIKVKDQSGQALSSYIGKGLVYAVSEYVDAIVLPYSAGSKLPVYILQGVMAANDANIPVICAAGNDGKNISEEGNRE